MLKCIKHGIITSSNSMGNRYHLGPGPGGGQFTTNPYKNRYEVYEPMYTSYNIKTRKPTDGSKRISGVYDRSRSTLSPKGQERYNYELQKNLQKPSNKRADPDALNDPDRWIREDLENAKSTAEGFRDMSRYTGDLARTFIKPAGKQRYDLSELSDAELRAILNREAMERQYSDYFAPKTVSKGENFVKAMDVLGTIGSLGVTALGIALSVQKLRGKGG